jgi:hypothetical protein
MKRALESEMLALAVYKTTIMLSCYLCTRILLLDAETFNRRLRCFETLSRTFTHGWDKHKLAFEAVVVTVQYQMENGSPIFCV